MKPFTIKERKVVLVLTDIAVLVAVTAGFLGFGGFKSLNLVAIALFIGFISLGIFVTGFVGSRVSEKPVWKNLKIGGRWFTYAMAVFVIGQMIGQIR